MSRAEIENIVDALGLHYLYVPHASLAPQHRGFESTPLSGRIQVTLPEHKRVFYKTVGHAEIDLDEAQRMVSLRVVRGNVPR